jgi:predicted nucleic acid-binding protein
VKKVFIDANVLIAVLNKEYPLFSDAARILSLADRSGYNVYTSPVCIAIAFYFAEKKSGTLKAKTKLKTLMDHIKATTVDDEIIRQAIYNTSIHDIEDGIQYYSALRSDCKIIVTEDKNDYYFAEIPILNCREMLETLNDQK